MVISMLSTNSTKLITKKMLRFTKLITNNTKLITNNTKLIMLSMILLRGSLRQHSSLFQ